jgi:hypothetical protein
MDVNDMQGFGICRLDIVHPLTDEELATRKHCEEKSSSHASYIENACNTESILGLGKELLEERDNTQAKVGTNRFLSPGLRALWMSFPEQAPPGEHKQHNENALRTGLPCKIQCVWYKPPHCTPMIVTFVTSLEVENKCIRTCWSVVQIME